MLLDVIEGAQSPMSQTMNIILFAALIVGIIMIGFGVYSSLSKKMGVKQKNPKNQDDEYDDLYEDDPDDQEYAPIVTAHIDDIEDKPYSDLEISHSIKTNAYKMRDSIRIAHDIEDDVLKNNGFFEWYQKDGTPAGSAEFKGSAGVLAKSIEMFRIWAEDYIN